MPPYTAFHLGLHSLSKYSFSEFWSSSVNRYFVEESSLPVCFTVTHYFACLSNLVLGTYIRSIRESPSQLENQIMAQMYVRSITVSKS